MRPIPIKGVGIGLRAEHFRSILQTLPKVPWFEALTENYIHQGERALYHLERVREHYPLTLHGVSLSIGSSDSLNLDYLNQLKALIKAVQPNWISDHLCWTSVQNQYVPDLLPLPYTEEALSHVVNRIQQVQNFLGQRILIENVSSYLSYTFSRISEWEFLAEVASKADCYLLLDVNNVYVSAYNHGFDALTYIKHLPASRIKEIHLAGFEEQQGSYLLDTHSQPVHPPVWELYKQTIKWLGNIPTLIEWDINIPSFQTLENQRLKAVEIQELSTLVSGSSMSGRPQDLMAL